MSSPTSIPKPPQQTAQQAGEKRTAPSLSPEITVVDGTESLSAPPPAKKPRMSGSGSGAGDGDAGSVDDKENSKTPAFAAAANSKTTTTIKATTATPKKPSTGVKKTIFMPGFGPKPTSPAIPKQLAENLSVPLPPTSSAPATAGAAPDIAALKRDFVDALPADLKELLDMEIETMGDDWFVALRGEFVKPYFRDVSLPLARDMRLQMEAGKDGPHARLADHFPIPLGVPISSRNSRGRLFMDEVMPPLWNPGGDYRYVLATDVLIGVVPRGWTDRH
ncbi:hypothetical protein QFC19_003982 [Naganishia cerealis]|uniref:Uncharacterized protein n=1 Tax=Naganishia cerealis TaxID=610337 RepID=A0ACC2VZM2_9TREE|nr:hypothetical protein QFC19_003982 [Naganishia cerealis]